MLTVESVRALARRLALWVTGSDSKLPASTFFLFPFLLTLLVAVFVSTNSGLKRINTPRLAFCQTKAIVAHFLSPSSSVCFSPLTGPDRQGGNLSLAYTPSFVIYFDRLVCFCFSRRPLTFADRIARTYRLKCPPHGPLLSVP